MDKKLVLHMRLRCGSLTITTSVLLLANEIDVRANELDSYQLNVCLHEALFDRNSLKIVKGLL